MSFTSLASVLIALLPSQTTPAAPAPLAYDLRLSPGERLLGYRWDGGARVPYLAADTDVRIEFGERGLARESRLYLPGQALFEAPASGAIESTSVSLALEERGRFGRALRFAPGSFLRLALAGATGSAGWSVSFWVRPEPAAFGRPLVLLPGAVEVVLQGDGRVRAGLLPAGERATSASALAAGKWSFVCVAHDPFLTRQLRLFVDGDAQRTALALGAPPRSASELWVGDLARNGLGADLALDELSLETFALSTAQAQQLWRGAPEAGVHTLEVSSTNGLRTVAEVAQATTQTVLDTDADFALGALKGARVEGGSLRWSPGSWRDLAPRLAPPPRTTHALVSLGGQRVFTFGGETRDTHFGPMVNTADTWIFEGASNTWERVPTALAPSPRCHVPAAYSPDHGAVLLVGGWRNDSVPGAAFADTWLFDVRTRQWEQRFPSGDPIHSGSDYGLVYLPALRSFLLLHGRNNALYDPVADRWQRLPLARAVTEGGQATTFSVGASPMCGLVPSTGEVVVFGGSSGPDQMTFSDTTALYDVRTNTYTVLDTPVRPSARVRAGFAFDSRRGAFVLFGGVRDQFSARHDDLWAFDPARRRWQELACSNRPGPRGGYYGMAYDEVADRFVLYGGRSSPERWLDETLALELDPRRNARALYTFDRQGPAGPNTWFAESTTPGNSRVSFLFRGSDTNASWTPWRVTTAGLASHRYLQVIAFLQPDAALEAPSIERMGLR